MIEKKAYAKINLSLDVLGKLENGYHEVCMIMQTIGLCDELSFDVYNISPGEERIHLSCFFEDGGEAPTENVKDNLVYKAAMLMLPYMPADKGVDIKVVKHIPMAAGMAGGSTDAAAALKGINELFRLGLTDGKLCELGVKIGADVPYCIMGGTMVAEGIGEKLSPIKSAAGINLVIAKPEEGVSTKYVYEALDALDNPAHPDVKGMIRAIEDSSVEGIASKLGNILEEVTIPVCPKVKKIKDILLENGALGALMSGSGPTVFGIFETKEKAVIAADILRKLQTPVAKDIFVTTTWDDV
ncbi:MAG: 4-(cytidine 5'-diphospho)-2-C-methyl-D-erythritol kinase [Lachnospiraceae bacterium]|nr:4-(cytidine 5'-diphospho)-2-C-methyl-D-erythritol kinase [Lachnospiraceae bacterium]